MLTFAGHAFQFKEFSENNYDSVRNIFKEIHNHVLWVNSEEKVREKDKQTA